MRAGAETSVAFLRMSFQTRLRYWRSFLSVVLVVPALTVRTMTPRPWPGSMPFIISRRRVRSSSLSTLRETPICSCPGVSTRKRPASDSQVVRKAPLLPVGSLTTCTSTSWPGLSTFWMGGNFFPLLGS